MSIPFAIASQYFERATQEARRSMHTTPVYQPGGRQHEVQVVPKEQRAALQAAYELMSESTKSQTEKQRVSEARVAMQEFRGPPPSNPMVAAVDGMNMSGRIRRIKKQMVQRRW